MFSRSIVAALLLVASAANAAGPYDPELEWRTVATERFAVHYPEGAYNLAVRVAHLAEEVLDDVGELFGYLPDGRIEIVLSDASDHANGSAQVMPKNIVRMFLTAPTELTGLSSYDDWLRILLVHELAHICDIDQTWGLTRFLRWIFGKYIQMNGFAPQFLYEGAAVYAETVLTSTGRGRSSFVAMLIRMAALEGQFVEIDQAHVQFSDWPGPNAAYWYGGLFHLWLAEKFGRDAVRDLHQYYASMPLPYIYWFGAESVLGDSLPDLWERWHQEELQYALEVKSIVEQAGITPSRRLTSHGRNITGARYHPSGEFIIYSRSSPEDGSTVRRVALDGTDDRYLVLETFSPRFSFAPDGSSFYYSQNAINERFNDYADLYRYDMQTGEAIQLVDAGDADRSLRARDPDISPDGQRIVFVQNELHQSWISVGRITGEERDQLEVDVLVGPHGDMQHASPRFSPDGALIAVSTWFEGGHRDIVLVDARTGDLVRRVTHDEALDGNPAWSPDGRYLLYESDIDGISNIYAYDSTGDAYFRLTRVVGGAFQPDVSPDGGSMLFRNASGIGFDIHEMPFDPATWEPLRYDPDTGYLPQGSEPRQDGPRPAWTLEGWGEGLARSAQPALELGEGEVDDAYSPLPTLLPLHDNWILLPALFLLNGDPSIRLATLGQDVLGTHTYTLFAGSSLHLQHLNWGAAYFNDQWYPTFAASFADLGEGFYDSASKDWIGRRRLTGAFSINLPIKQRHMLAASYTWDRRTELTPNASEDLTLGDFGRVELGYRYSFTRRFPFSVGAEHGKSFAVALRWYNTALGADFNELLFNVDGRWYLNNPLLPNHVLALRVAGAFAIGPDFEEGFILGGAQGSSIFTVQSESVYPLRGFPIDLDLYPENTGLLAAYSEYRFPLWHVERGLWTVPVYLERLHAAVFADVGTTFDVSNAETVTDAKGKIFKRALGGRLGAGLELRADVSLGWAFPLTVRSGLAWPLVDHGRGVPDPQARIHWYLSFGSAI